MSKSERSRKLAAEFGMPLKGKGKGGKGTGREGVNLYIKNLDESITDEKLRELFCTFGKITSGRVATDDKGTSKGFGFVCFSPPEEATKAVTEMHLKMVSGKPLYVGLAEQREQRVARLAQRFKGGGKGGGFGGGFGMGGMGGMYGMGGKGFGGMGGMGGMYGMGGKGFG